MATLRLRRTSEEIWSRVRPLIAKLNGAANQIRLYDPSKIFPRGEAAGINNTNRNGTGNVPFSDGTTFSDGTAFAEGASTARLGRTHRRGERVVFIQGLKPSQEIALMADDFLQVGGYLHMATAQVKSNAEGKALVPIFPALRVDIPAGSLDAAVNFVYASSPFALAQPFTGFDVRFRNFADDITLNFIEVLP